MMDEFKVGDRVESFRVVHVGETGTIESFTESGKPRVRYDRDGFLCCREIENLRPIKEKTVEYKLLKPVSIKAIEEAGPKNCAEFRRELHRAAFLSVKMAHELGCSGITPYTFEWDELDEVIKLASQRKGGIQFLIDHGFIEEVVERPDFAMDDTVLVRDSIEDRWKERCFAAWGMDKIVCWFHGKNSRSTNKTLAWKYWKLPEEK
jgi:hypothetical protein